ncbi:YraN family protein [Clostridium gasigenes]|uniref:YraN family protein n=1 Tax=Clostridium gasigenes TaxID=94869 RepID=UPI0014386827|nr:YraN family protein [Clostridium gasigenes]NKF06029.1 YraN family protein [Clostridium gasigenes]QSW19248.1 YraN family protein [Clostridium gasigenes]
MKGFNKDIGNYGEDLAFEFLKRNGYFILSRNFRNRCGEIDIICKKYDLIIFVEIKSRYNYNYGSPIEAITYSKQKQIIKLCKFYIYINKLINYNFRFDVIEVFFNKDNNLYSINHITDAFRES